MKKTITIIIAIIGIGLFGFSTNSKSEKVVVIPVGASAKATVAGTDKQIQYNDQGAATGADVYYDKTTQSIGIGVVTPGAKLEINGEAGTLIKSVTTIDDSVGNGANNLIGHYIEQNFIAGGGGGNTVHALHINSNITTGGGGSNEYSAIYVENGKVGIGTAIPKSNLAVTGLPTGTNDSVTTGFLAGALCITTAGDLYIDTDGTCAN